MKKFIILLVAIFIANLGCKKIVDKEGLCACSPIPYASLFLVVQNSGGADLLNTANVGSFSASQIQLFQKDNNGINKQISFSIRPGFSFGTGKFEYSQIYSTEIAALAQTITNSFYLKFGNNSPMELNLQVNSQKQQVEKLLIDKKDAPVENGDVSKYVSSIFYLKL